jgi:hypothetical protein
MSPAPTLALSAEDSYELDEKTSKPDIVKIICRTLVLNIKF